MKLKYFLLSFYLGLFTNSFTYNIGLLVVATGKYTQFIPPLVESVKKYFCIEHNVTVFILTDGTLPEEPGVVVLPHKRYGWPFDTLFRFHGYYHHFDAFEAMDYLFACDADMLFVDTVGDEILGDLVGTQHPGYVGKRGTYEERYCSQAYVAPHEGQYYFAGGFYGGKKTQIKLLLEIVTDAIKKDLDKGIIAIWHDESYLNRYFIDYKPTIILPKAYCALSADVPRKLVALFKNNNEFHQ